MNRLHLLLFASIFVLAGNVSVFACACFGPDSPKEALKVWSDVVFLGEVTTTDGTSYNFRVERVWKGVDGRVVVVRDAYPRTSCSTRLKPGERYIVFASVNNLETGKPILLDEQQKPVPFLIFVVGLHRCLM